MAAPAAGQVVLIPFPYSDLSQYKVRPTVCLAVSVPNDVVMCQVTSNAYGDSKAVSLVDEDFQSGGLDRMSFARPGKSLPSHSSIIIRDLGRLTSAATARLLAAVVEVFSDRTTR